MTRAIVITITLLCALNGALWASQTCPKELTIINGTYLPPSGWHVTLSNLNPSAKTLLFYIVTFNWDKKTGANNNKMSCYYEDRMNKNQVEITTDKSFSKPTDSAWQTLDETTQLCFPNRPVNPLDCPLD